MEGGRFGDGSRCSTSRRLCSDGQSKLTQIFDNLILNSQYWLRESIRRGKKPPGKITIELKPPFVMFSDNGRGTDPTVAGTLFEAFVTTRQGGRGLGLFIVRELLESDPQEPTSNPDMLLNFEDRRSYKNDYSRFLASDKPTVFN